MIKSGRQLQAHGTTAFAKHSSFIVLAFLCLLGGAGHADDDIGILLERAAHPGVTALTAEGQAVIDDLLDHFNAATARQQVDIRIIQARGEALAGDYRRGIERLKQLLSRDIDSDQHVRVRELLANMLLQIDRHHAAFTHMEAALELAAEVESAPHQARVYSLAAYWYSELGERERGRQLADEATELSGRIEDPWEVCLTLEKVVLARRALGEPRLAMEVAEQALAACRQAEDPIFTSALTILLGKLHHQLGETDAAERRLTEGVALAERQDYTDGLLLGRIAHARLLVEQHRYEEAEQMLIDRVAEIETRQRWRHLRDARLLLSQAAGERGNHQQADQHLQRYLEAHERYLEALRQRAVSFQQVQLGARARARELELMREKARSDALSEQARAQRQRLLMIGIGLLALIVAILTVLIMHAVRERRHYRRLSRRDSLTGLRNHTRFFEAAENVLRQCRMRGEQAILVLADIDHFKRINDSHGHQAGDEVIRRVASRLQEVFGPHGITGRIGGEEFAVVVPNQSLRQVRELIESWRQAVKRSRQSDPGEDVTISCGVARSRDSLGLAALRQAADDALYAAKRGGRNRVVVAGEG
jgi:diguanylate cyclase (GGDEF)-like protein